MLKQDLLDWKTYLDNSLHVEKSIFYIVCVHFK